MWRVVNEERQEVVWGNTHGFSIEDTEFLLR